MKKILTIALIAVLVVCALLLVACDKEEKKDDTTTAASTTAAKTTAAKTTAEPTTAEPTTEALTTAFPKELKDVMPATLPDGSKYEAAIRVDFENANDYKVTGNSYNSGKYGFDADGIYGKALWVGRGPETSSNTRGEVEVEPNDYAFDVGGCSGILFWVDFTGSVPDPTKEGACASITMDTNDYRANKSDKMSIGYYYLDGQWIETHNVNACRMQLTPSFKGWVYIPATSYVYTKDTAKAIVDENGNFIDMTTYTFRAYSDWYDHGAGVEFKVVFDEIMWVKKVS